MECGAGRGRVKKVWTAKIVHRKDNEPSELTFKTQLNQSFGGETRFKLAKIGFSIREERRMRWIVEPQAVSVAKPSDFSD